MDDSDAAWRAVGLVRDAGVPSGDVGLLLSGAEVLVAHPAADDQRNDAGVGPLCRLIATATTGGVLPPRHEFLDPDSDLTVDDVLRLGVELEAGRSAVLVLATKPGVDQPGPPTTQRVLPGLTELGGKVEVHHLTERALRIAIREVRPNRSGQSSSRPWARACATACEREVTPSLR